MGQTWSVSKHDDKTKIQKYINKEEALTQVNLAHKKGGMCGDEKMPVGKELSWYDKLE